MAPRPLGSSQGVPAPALRGALPCGIRTAKKSTKEGQENKIGKRAGSGEGDREIKDEANAGWTGDAEQRGSLRAGLGQGRVWIEGPSAALVEGRAALACPALPLERSLCPLRGKSRSSPGGTGGASGRQAAVKPRSACCSFLCLRNLYLPFRTKGSFLFSLCFYWCHSKNEIFRCIFPFFQQLLSIQPLLSAN